MIRSHIHQDGRLKGGGIKGKFPVTIAFIESEDRVPKPFDKAM